MIGVNGSATGPEGIGVSGSCAQGVGVRGDSDTSVGVVGFSRLGNGVRGTSDSGKGVLGELSAVLGQVNPPAMGFIAGTDPQFGQHAGVYGESAQQGVMGLTTVAKGTGAYGGGTTAAGGDQIGVRGETGTGVGVQGQSFGLGLAGRFIGDVEVTGDIRLSNQDCAEDFDISSAEEIEPGTVMVIEKDGALQISQWPYDKRVAGVVSGAGDCRPGIILGRQQLQNNRMPVALVGKVHCKVDASYSAIEIGDLLRPSRSHRVGVARIQRSAKP